MSIHIEASPTDIAEIVLLPGDPVRTQYIAETFLTKAKCYNKIRGALGYTGEVNNKRVSIQSTGMGIPSASIYINELIREYNSKVLIRVGTTGAAQSNINLRDIILPIATATDSNINNQFFNKFNYPPCADFNLLMKAYECTKELDIQVHVGPILTTDSFYAEDQEQRKKLFDHGILAVEMETAVLYTLANRYQVKALSILTVSDHIISGETTSANDRESTFDMMVELALKVVESI